MLARLRNKPSQWILPIILAVFLACLTQAAVASPNEKQIVQRLAQDILLHYFSHGSEGPLIVGIDGPPGSGKTWFIARLKAAMEQFIRELYLGLSVGVFSGDALLRPRDVRFYLFQSDHGPLGGAGNCNGCEYRWSQLESAVRAISFGEPFQIRPYDRDTGELGPETERHLTDSIVIVEGTHTLGERLFPYIHYPIFLDIDDNLMAWSRRKRDLKRGAKKILATLRAVFNRLQLFQWRARHRNRAWVQLRYDPVVDPGELNEGNFDTPPDNLDRELRLLSAGGGFRILGVQRQEAGEGGLNRQLQQIIDNASMPAAEAVMSKAEFIEKLLVLLKSLDLGLQSICHGNDCLFQALGAVLGERFSSREKVTAILLQLLDKYHTRQLSQAQKRLLEWLTRSIDSEIEHLVEGQWGGLPTVMYIWASLLGETQIPPFTPLVLLINTGTQIETWQFNVNGSIDELETVPEGVPLLIYDGFDSWHAAAPQNVVLHTMNSQGDSGYLGSEEDSPPGSGPASLTQSSTCCCLAEGECQNIHRPLVLQPMILREHLREASLF